MPSFSSSLLDAIYHSIEKEPVEDYIKRRNGASSAQVEEEIESLRRAIMIEKWMENHGTNTMSRSRRVPSNSGSSSTNSSMFSASSETDSSASIRSSSLNNVEKQHVKKICQDEITPKSEGRFTRTKSRAMKIYGDLKKVKEPMSPGGKIASFLNTIFTPRNLKKNQGLEDNWNSIRKSRSMKENPTTATTCSLASGSCLSKNPSSKCNKSKRVVRFCTVNEILLHKDPQTCGSKTTIHHRDEYNSVNSSLPSVGSRFIKKNIDSFRVYDGAKSFMRRHEFYDDHDIDVDDKSSCASSDLFELENIGRIGLGVYDDEELPVYETTSLKLMNKAIC